MSRDGLKQFVHAVEHSAALRREVVEAKAPDQIVALATSHGFAVNEHDLKDDAICSATESWFNRSWIRH